MDAQENLTAIQTAKARAEEATAAAAGLDETTKGALQTVIALFTELTEGMQTAATAAENAHSSAGAALESTYEHLNSTPGDHSTVPSILTAKDACETAVNGLAFAHDGVKDLPAALQQLADDFTTAVAALMTGKMEEITGMMGQSQGALDTAETHIAAIKA